jgi:predicted amidohydrolase YtcJ
MKTFYNARIYTLDETHPTASAIAIEHGRGVAVGETDDLLSEFDRAEKQDIGGNIILPGLIDSHPQLQQYALSQQKIGCETDMPDECLHRVQERIRSAQPGESVLGHGWNQNNWGAWPSIADLDKIAPDNPVYLTAKSLHTPITRQRADGSPGPEGWYPEQRLSLQQAIEGYTLGPAYTAGTEDYSGKLSPGYLADSILLEQDPFVIPPADLLETVPLGTTVGGEWVWRS